MAKPTDTRPMFEASVILAHLWGNTEQGQRGMQAAVGSIKVGDRYWDVAITPGVEPGTIYETPKEACCGSCDTPDCE